MIPDPFPYVNSFNRPIRRNSIGQSICDHGVWIEAHCKDCFGPDGRNPTQTETLRHYRVIDQQGRFQGGEWCDPVAAQVWAARQVRGASRVVECDIYGRRLVK